MREETFDRAYSLETIRTAAGRVSETPRVHEPAPVILLGIDGIYEFPKTETSPTLHSFYGIRRLAELTPNPGLWRIP